MKHNRFICRQSAWASFRLSVIGQLLASPPGPGLLKSEIEALAARSWQNPLTDQPVHFAFSTIEQWYYQAKAARHDPVKALSRKCRKDRGRFRRLKEDIRQAIKELHRLHCGWTHQLHYDNLLVVARNEKLGPVPSYSTVRRYRNVCGLIRLRMPKNAERAGVVTALNRLETRERRGYEATHVMGLFHSDFHHCSRKLLNGKGEWASPVLVVIMDDRSRLICHAQWYWRETAENFVHALCQAFLKRGLPRAIMTDNGSAMKAGETTEGLRRLGIEHKRTLPYSPYQNGKQESLWGQVEGRLMAMLEGEELTLQLLNESTIAWVEMDYHRKLHSEIHQTPLDRYLDGPEVGRPRPSPEELRNAFMVNTTRSLRRSDCTISLEGRRYEIPSRLRHVKRISVRYATWDLSYVLLVNAATDELIGRTYPRNLEKNANGHRRAMEQRDPHWKPPDPSTGMAPLLKQYIADYIATGLPMSYLTKSEREE